ncbi:MAG: nuclear transport factor 2 family protein [Myxococcota bacterium]
MSSRKGRTTGKQAAKKSGAGKGTLKKAAAKKAAAGKGTAKQASKAKTTKKRAAKKAAPKPFVPVLSGPEKLAIVERYIAAYNARDTATILSLYSPKATMEDPIGLPAAKGHEAIGGLYQMGFDMNVTIAHDGAVRCAGNSVAFPLIASSPTSKLHVIDVFDFGPDGKIVQMRAYWGPDNLVGDLAVRQS